MNDRIRNLLNQMTALEDEMRTALHEQETKMFFEIKGRRIEFEKAIKQTHRKLKKNFFRWLVTNRPQNLLTGPIIYGMIIPLMMLLFGNRCLRELSSSGPLVPFLPTPPSSSRCKPTPTSPFAISRSFQRRCSCFRQQSQNR